jgi:hypothetical protein
VGQEILYCNKCGKKLLGEDFTRGRAHTFNNRQFCSACVPQSISSGAQAALKEPRPVERPPAARPKPLKPVTARATPAAAPPSANRILLVGLAVIAVTVGILYVVRSSGSSDPAPEPVTAKPPPAPAPAPRPQPPKPAPPSVSKEKIAKDLQDLEAKIQPTLQNEQFSAAIGLLEEAQKRVDVPEWTQGVAKLIQDAQGRAAALYGPIKAQSSSAQFQGASADVRKARDRLVGWGRKDLLDDFDKAIAAIVPHEPLPAGATVLAVFPNGDLSRYRYAGEMKDGALIGVRRDDTVTVGMESGAEIFKVPHEGQVRVTFTTSSPKRVNAVFRAVTSAGKNFPFNFFLENPVVGRPQVFRCSISEMKSWDNDLIQAGSIVDNLYFLQYDRDAVLTVHEIVIFKTKD